MYCVCVWLFIFHGLFTLQLLDDNVILIIKINNTFILWLKGLKISIIDSTLVSVIQQLVLEKVPLGKSLTIGRRSWIILRMEYHCSMVRMVLSMRYGAERRKYFYRHGDIIFGYHLLQDMIVQKGQKLQPRRNWRRIKKWQWISFGKDYLIR